MRLNHLWDLKTILSCCYPIRAILSQASRSFDSVMADRLAESDIPPMTIPLLMAATLLTLLPAGVRDPLVEWSGPPGSSKPHLTRTARGDLLLSWLEPRAGQRFALRATSRVGNQWSEPVTVVESDRFFVNWADFASITETATGAWVVHWLEKTAAKSYAYHIRLAASKDRGRTWSAPVTVHSDTSATEHGFAAMVPLATGAVAVAWLDGRQMTDSAGAMTVRTANWNPDGSVSAETTLDPRTCECCQVSMAAAKAGLVAVYRDRSDQEVRDIAIVRQIGGQWSAPAKVGDDGWVSRQCPVNGPSIAAVGDAVGVAWFTAANGTPMVKAALSQDGGRTFGLPIRIDDGNPLGRVHVQVTGPGRGAVTWLEAKENDGVWRVRQIGTGRDTQPARTVGATTRTRDAGFPRTALIGSDLYVAYTEPGSTVSAPGRVRVTKLTLTR